jgi:hypothetical protein
VAIRATMQIIDLKLRMRFSCRLDLLWSYLFD